MSKRPSYGDHVLAPIDYGVGERDESTYGAARRGELHPGRVCRVDEESQTVLVEDELGFVHGTFRWADLEYPRPFDIGPVEYGPAGRHRPQAFHACKQDPDERAIARARLTDGAEQLVECDDCGELFERGGVFWSHDCQPEPHPRAPQGGSCNYADAQAQREFMPFPRLRRRS